MYITSILLYIVYKIYIFFFLKILKNCKNKKGERKIRINSRKEEKGHVTLSIILSSKLYTIYENYAIILSNFCTKFYRKDSFVYHLSKDLYMIYIYIS